VQWISRNARSTSLARTWPRAAGRSQRPPDEVIFLTTRDAYEPHYVDDRKYFELENFYDEFGKPWDQRRLPMRYEPRNDAVDVYRFWQERNGGDRRVTLVRL
jgi:hypothetical protein